ncbi:mannitol dehydrogenase family protein [Halomonas sp. DP8Y7-1]|uniref:mannitol dehydrogenase family protein n=1 Tax=unclassified Halomonas TaxID=2609666 RepID=UPI001C94B11A|nr:MULTISPECIES: mannitol dehydrogenase family protein [unclassified Halomonas]MBY5929411.1 mannitol dehydrogenase family protein [Halomonas sp. DP8Y7-3]MBY6028609.1 mannitol dehydrogenase family protein [Halomonas sp. DP8Y7-1]
MTRLSNATLAHLDPHVSVPSYRRTALTPGMAHIGVGGFHRAHQAMYLDRLMEAGQAHDWGIVGIGVMPGDRRMQEALASQDYLYTLVVKHPNGVLEPRVIGSIIDYRYAPDDPEGVIEMLADPAIRIVSLTVTEGGYNVHPITGEFDLETADVLHDLEHPMAPRSSFGLVVAAIERRRDRGLAPFTVMSCDNIPGNGDVARRMFGAFAHARDPQLGQYLEAQVPFPNSMVDRITPVTTPADIEELHQRFDLEDAWPVICEPFTQWVLEDHFAMGRPALDDVGVQVVEDVEPYELMKLRLLNASHQAMCYLGYLAGYRYAHEVCQDPLFVEFLLGYMEDEGSPTLPEVPGVDLDQYRHTLIERFANPEIKDTLARLCAESSDRIPKWLVPVIRRQLEQGGALKRSATVVASWARYAEGVDEQGQPIAVVDRLKDQLTPIAASQHARPTAFIENRELFGSLAEAPRFVDAYVEALKRLQQQGARATLEALAADETRSQV